MDADHVTIVRDSDATEGLDRAVRAEIAVLVADQAAVPDPVRVRVPAARPR